MLAAAPNALKRFARFGLHRLGGLRPLIWSSRKRFRILTYHRLSSVLYPGAAAALDRQCAFLRSQFHPLPLSEIARSLNTGAALPPGALAVTVDDGYRDFLVDGFPIFRKWRIPVTVFLMTDFVDRKLWPWWNQVAYAAQHGRARRVRLSLTPKRDEQQLPLETEVQRQSAADAICALVKKLPNRGRLAFLDRLAELFELEMPRQAPPEHAPLTWDDARRLAADGVEFGAHTKTHPILPRVEDEELIVDEIAGSKARVEQELGRPAIHFCYPNGDYNSEGVDVVARCGFQSAVTVDAGLNTRRADRYLLKRLPVALDLPDEYFREQVAGMHV